MDARDRRRPRLPALPWLGALACVPMPALASPAAAQPLAWLAVGGALGVALALAVCWLVLRERLVTHEAWAWMFATAVGVAGMALFTASRWPGLTAGLAVAVLAWGLLVVHALSARTGAMLLERDRARAEAHRARENSERDALTGVLNRAAWRARLERMGEDARQDRRPMSVLFFDIDLFKLINDSLGHQVGDDCLKAVAATVAAELRGGDILGRLGGEEFAVALPGAKRIHALAVGERIRQAVQRHCQVVGEEVVELTVSVGAAEYLGEEESYDALMDRADRAMYSAKGAGRNMVVADAAVAPGNGP